MRKKADTKKVAPRVRFAHVVEPVSAGFIREPLDSVDTDSQTHALKHWTLPQECEYGMGTATVINLSELYMILKDRKLLAQLMENRNVSARQLSAEVGWKSHSYMNRLLRGEAKTLKPDVALRIAHYFHVPVDLLFLLKSSTDTVQTAKQRSRVA